MEHLQATLAGIERRVLGEVWIGARRGAALVSLTVVVLVASVTWCYDSVTLGSGHVPVVGLVALIIATGVSVLALARRRFHVCCAAAYTCGLAAVIGIGALWWLRTGQPGVPQVWVIIADMAAVLLTLGWLSVVMTPIELSQPQMRTGLGTGS